MVLGAAAGGKVRCCEQPGQGRDRAQACPQQLPQAGHVAQQLGLWGKGWVEELVQRQGLAGLPLPAALLQHILVQAASIGRVLGEAPVQPLRPGGLARKGSQLAKVPTACIKAQQRPAQVALCEGGQHARHGGEARGEHKGGGEGGGGGGGGGRGGGRGCCRRCLCSGCKQAGLLVLVPSPLADHSKWHIHGPVHWAGVALHLEPAPQAASSHPAPALDQLLGQAGQVQLWVVGQGQVTAKLQRQAALHEDQGRGGQGRQHPVPLWPLQQRCGCSEAHHPPHKVVGAAVWHKGSKGPQVQLPGKLAPVALGGDAEGGCGSRGPPRGPHCQGRPGHCLWLHLAHIAAIGPSGKGQQRRPGAQHAADGGEDGAGGAPRRGRWGGQAVVAGLKHLQAQPARGHLWLAQQGPRPHPGPLPPIHQQHSGSAGGPVAGGGPVAALCLPGAGAGVNGNGKVGGQGGWGEWGGGLGGATPTAAAWAAQGRATAPPLLLVVQGPSSRGRQGQQGAAVHAQGAQALGQAHHASGRADVRDLPHKGCSPVKGGALVIPGGLEGLAAAPALPLLPILEAVLLLLLLLSVVIEAILLHGVLPPHLCQLCISAARQHEGWHGSKGPQAGQLPRPPAAALLPPPPRAAAPLQPLQHACPRVALHVMHQGVAQALCDLAAPPFHPHQLLWAHQQPVPRLLPATQHWPRQPPQPAPV